MEVNTALVVHKEGDLLRGRAAAETTQPAESRAQIVLGAQQPEHVGMTLEGTFSNDDDNLLADDYHRHSDPIMEHVPQGTHYKSPFKHVLGCGRRKTGRLG